VAAGVGQRHGVTSHLRSAWSVCFNS
jgi:hypothetical protein